MRLKIDHETTYSYDEPVPYGLQRLRLIPKNSHYQSLVSWDLEVTGGTIEAEFEDQHKNATRLIRISPEQHTVAIRSHGVVETKDVAGIIGAQKGYAPLWFFKRDTELTKPAPELRKFLKETDPGGDDEIARFHTISRGIFEAVTYETGRTDSTTNAETALRNGHGVCQDHAHILITLARMLDYPARYVSGYLMMNDRILQDASHAWAQVHIPDLGWVGFDVSNQVSPDERYVHLATGLDYGEAAPISGIRFGNGNEALSVSLQVQQ